MHESEQNIPETAARQQEEAPNEEAKAREWEERLERHHRRSRIWAGLFILLVGAMALLKSFNLPLPEWLFSWQMLIIGLGLFIGLRHRFRGGAWILPILVGLAFLTNDYFLQLELRKHLWPVLLILVGIILLIKPHSNHHRRCRAASRGMWRERQARFHRIMEETSYNREDYLDSTSVFGGSKKKIITKDFKGGDIVNVFGGTELDLSQADIQARAELEVVAIFGGASLIVPSNWNVKSEVETLFGGIQDKRTLQPGAEQSGKVLLLKGTVIFGGIEIKSY